MGARAAVMAARQETTHLVLVSYPLHTPKDLRDQILLDIPEHVKVIFVTGERDEMCDLQRLEDVRGKMACRTWRVVVKGADHGMNCKPRSATEEMQRETGRVVAGWLDGDGAEEDKREGRTAWDGEGGVVRWSGWADGEGDWGGDGQGHSVHAPFSPGGDVEKVANPRTGRRPAEKGKKERSKRRSKSAKGAQPAKKRKAQDQDTSKEADGETKRKSSKRR